MSELGGKRTLTDLLPKLLTSGGEKPGVGMSDFEYLFSFYGLLLGLAVANVATGFADMWRERQAIPVGVCVPLLAVIVLLGGMNVWLSHWNAREVVAVDAWRMLSAAGVALPYVFISRAMFPSGDQKQPLDDHYLAHRRVVLWALSVPPIVSAVSNLLLNHGSYDLWGGLWMTLRIVSPMLLIPFSSARTHRIGLTAIIFLLVIGLFR